MSITDTRSPLEELRATYGPVFDEIGLGALQRELDDVLPDQEVRRLKERGFGALRVPTRYGGRGASIPELTQLWIDLAAADSNLPQALRGHAALVEDRLWQHAQGRDQRVWFDRFAAGEIAGNAWSEVGATAIDSQQTVLAAQPDGSYRLTGSKFYTTGTIYAEWADVYARIERDGAGLGQEPEFAIAIVDTREPEVIVTDDWDGFGQRGTGSGTTTFDGAVVAARDVLPFGERFPYQTALYQLNLLAVLTGIGRAALTDFVGHVRDRERNYSHANAARVRDDPQVLARIGEASAAVYAAEAATLRVAEAIQEVADLAPVAAGAADRVAAANERAEVESSAAQVVVTSLVLDLTSDLFDTLGASGTSLSKGLDRHWRNARTVSSHNPRILKARVVGAHLVNGTPPPYAWAIGRTAR
ncbi:MULTISPECIES: acyl-CoA dehydrogenase family protein [unclassified Nocardioides]|uniref:acyl-CoA dehydrogenase family protein n=1 Tax=unclassified Nocardioides TaxID=2615069 RepID=UPI0007024595|nr:MULTISPECIES: acyl-CoA dehydrogenase family protein [unclassified Nocardioides]KRC51442.1 monooxygenase [Nocardioides sp. Root79]KRC69051.1 monooxygenase [Nocardioides sp. Root240]